MTMIHAGSMMNKLDSTSGASTTGTASTSSSSSTATSALANAADNTDFLQLIIAQMKNQNPMDPTSSDQMVQSMSMMQLVNETHQMNTKMASWAQSQGLLLGANLIGGKATVNASDGTQVQGQISATSVTNGVVQVNIKGNLYPLSSVVNVQ